MAPSKRSRTNRANDDTVSERSDFRQESSKRQRISNVNGRPSRTPESTEPSDAEEVAPDHHAIPASTQSQYEIDRDKGFKHLENAERDDERATQAIMARSQALGENRPADNGIIESITCVNFMCHERLHVTLGPLINFIIGHNGSGKSAILTGIALCLGGKASTTNRGGSLKSFIKEGREAASLTVKLANRGADAYQPDLYGEAIIVERLFSRAGTSSFKLKSANGRVISSKKGDVEDVIEHFQMQIDNPMNILTQDAARQFLNSSSPAQKYKFFVKGVQLEQLDNDYQLLSEMNEATLDKIYVQEDNLKILEDANNAAQEKAKLIKRHENMRKAARNLIKQCAWSQVEVEERGLADRERRVAEVQAKIEEGEKRVEAKSAAYETVNLAAERASESVQEVLEALGPLKEEEAVAREHLNNATRELTEAHQGQREIRDFLIAAKNKVTNYEREIREEQQRLDNAHGGAHAELLAKIDVARGKVAEAKSQLDESEANRAQLPERLKEAENALEQLRGPIETKQREMQNCEAQLQALARDRANIMAAFDSKIPRLLNQIRQDDRFREKPIGPVGLHIKLLKPIWSTILEKSIGSILSGFIVTSKPDQALLSGLMRQMGLDNCPVLIGNNQHLDTSGYEPEPQYDTILRVLDIDNDLVRRQLIINQAIEQTLLIENREEAMRVMYDQGKPRNVKQCFCINTNKRGWGFRLAYQRNGFDQSVGPIQSTARPARMKTDVDSQISYQRETLQQLQRESNALETRRREAHRAVEKCHYAIKQHRADHRELQIALQRAEEEADRLQEELDSNNVTDGRLEALKDFLRDAKLEVEQHTGSYEAGVVAKDRYNMTSKALKATLDEVKVRIADHEAKIKKSEEKARRAAQARVIALQEKNAAIDAVNELQHDKERAEQSRARHAETVEQFITQASEISSRVPIDDGETPASLNAKLDRLNQQLKEYSRQVGGSDEEINRAAEEAKIKYEEALAQIQDLRDTCDIFKTAVAMRQERWRRFQQLISARSRIMFVYLLSERGFRGRLMLDHEHKLLDLNIEPDETTRSDKGRQTKTLSGGEKSFSSICLLLALWEAMGAPLRCLDEFDVFMDQVNRDISTKMIVSRLDFQATGYLLTR
jgi:chromosome segregation ATPase